MKTLVIFLVTLASLNVYSQKGYVIPDVPDEISLSTDEFKTEVNKMIIFFLSNKAFIPRNNVEFRFIESFSGDSTKLGETETIVLKSGYRTHTVWLKVDPDKERFIATLVHEFTHCVLREQVLSLSDLPVNEEGICEYVSYCYMDKYYPNSWVLDGHINNVGYPDKNPFYEQFIKIFNEKPNIWDLILL